MKPKFILINPWVYDFAAMNLWSRPLGLLMTAEYLSQFEIDIQLVDCTDELMAKRRFGTGKFRRQIIRKPAILRGVPKHYARYGITPDAFRAAVKSCLPCDLFLVTSLMSYWYPGVQKAIEIIRSIAPDVPVVLGGIYATLFNKHARENSGADYVFSGHVSNSSTAPGGADCHPGQETGQLKRDGLTGRSLGSVIKNFGIELIRTGGPEPYYKLGLYSSFLFAPVLTSVGCPYKCSYCASSILSDGFTQFRPPEVLRDIRALYDMGVRDFAFYDDALLANADSHLKLILREIIASNMAVRFHCPNGIHASFLDEELAYLMKKSGFTTLRLSLETVNAIRQVKTGGKVTSGALQSAVRNLKKCGFKKEHIGVYLMYGLPGQSLEEVQDGVNFLKRLDVRINLTEFSPIPGTGCWETLKDEIVINEEIDPLLTNNSVFTGLYSGYYPDDLDKLKISVNKFNNS